MKSETTIPSREDYLSHKVTHEKFYNSVAEMAEITFEGQDEFMEKVKRALANGDEHLNTIGLPIWDRMGDAYHSRLSRAFKAHGDFLSLVGVVCALKVAARKAAARKAAL